MAVQYYCLKDCEIHKLKDDSKKCRLLEDGITTQDNPELEICWSYFKSIKIKKGIDIC